MVRRLPCIRRRDATLDYDGVIRRGIVVTDIFAVTTAFLGAHVWRYGVVPDDGPLASVLLLGPTVTVVAFAALGLYRDRLDAEVGRVVLGVTAALPLLVFVTYWTDVYLPRRWLALSWVLARVLVIATRAAWRLGSVRSVGSRGAG
jgi:FlaA1/EpsC-like NDP-sugar epimerase